MRKLGFYGRDDWGIIDCTETDLIQLISNGKITVKEPVQTNLIVRHSLNVLFQW